MEKQELFVRIGAVLMFCLFPLPPEKVRAALVDVFTDQWVNGEYTWDDVLAVLRAAR